MNIDFITDEFRTQLQGTADDAVVKLEQQMMQFEYMLEEADAKIRLLEILLQQAEYKLMSPIPVAEPSFSGKDDSNQIRPFEPDNSSGKLHAVSTAKSATNVVKLVQTLQETVQDKRHQVVSMHRQGYNVLEIAKAASMGKGEVMLILELNKNL